MTEKFDDYYNCQKCAGTGHEPHSFLDREVFAPCDWCSGTGVNHHMQTELHRMCVVTLNYATILALYKPRGKESRSMRIRVPADTCLDEARELWRTGMFKHLEMDGPWTHCWSIEGRLF